MRHLKRICEKNALGLKYGYHVPSFITELRDVHLSCMDLNMPIIVAKSCDEVCSAEEILMPLFVTCK